MENESQEPDRRRLIRKAARRIISVRCDPVIRARMAHLATKANEGQLAGEERAEYESLVRTYDMFDVLKARARSILDQDL